MMVLAPPCLCRSRVASVEFANNNTLVSADEGGKTILWNVATGEEETEALAGSKFALSKHGAREQQTGRFICTADRDLLLIRLILRRADKVARVPVAFFRAPSPIEALDCSGAGIALGCRGGEVLHLLAAVLLT